MRLPTDPEHFARALRQGLGRCVVLLRSGADVGPYRETLENAFRADQGYDPQCEGSRAAYVFDLACAAHLEAELRSAAGEGLVADSGQWDAEQHAGVLVRFAQRGDVSAAELLRSRLASIPLDSPSLYSVAEFVAVLDGLAGVLLVARRLGEGADEPTHHAACAYHLSLAAESLGGEPVEVALREAAASEPRVAAFLRFAEAGRRGPRAPRTPDPQTTLDEMFATIAANPRHTRPWLAAMRWGRTAAPQALALAAARLATCTEPGTARVLLGVFRKAPYPGPTEVLFRLARSPDVALSRAAIAVLAARTSPEVRDEALRLLAQPKPEWEALSLLSRNYEVGDGERVAPLLAQVQSGPQDEIHRIGSALLDAFSGDARGADVIAPLKWLYEEGHCSVCRLQVIEALLKHQALDSETAAECRWDSNADIRQLNGIA